MAAFLQEQSHTCPWGYLVLQLRFIEMSGAKLAFFFINLDNPLNTIGEFSSYIQLAPFIGHWDIVRRKG